LDFVREHGVTFDFAKENLEVGKLAELELEIAGGRAKAATLEASLRRIEDRLAAEPATQTNLTVYEINALRETTKMKRLELQTGLIQARNVYREDSPEIQEILRNLRELDDIIAAGSERVEKSTSEMLNEVRQELLTTRNQLELELAGVRAGLAVMEETAATLRSRLSGLTAWMTELQLLDREFQLEDQKYKMLVQKRAQAAVASSTTLATTPSLRVIEFAVPPPSRGWPILKLLYPAALLVGLMLGVGVALILSYASGRIRREHVERGRGTAPLYSILEVPEEVPPLAVLPRGNGANAAASFESKR
ncbi:MAG: hypothetical protein ACRD88_00155, partial [Terriglobia bacterium]